MKRPGPDVRIQAVRDRRGRGTKNPYSARWVVAGREFSKSFPTKASAENYTSRLRVAHGDGERFDRATGLPSSWGASSCTVAEWAKTWLEGEWATLAPRSRKSIVEALVRSLPALVPPNATAPPERLREELMRSLRSDGGDLPAWIRRWSPPLSDVDRSMCADASKALGRNDEGKPHSESTARRYRKVTRQMLDAAVDSGNLAVNPWPKTARGRAQRKAVKKANPQAAIDLRRLPTPEQARSTIAALRTHQPSSEGYVITASLIYFAGMRPSEARVVSIEDLTLPEEGWGTAWVRSADQDAGADWTEPGEETGPTKTSTIRRVPLVPELTQMLRAYIGDRTTGLVVQTKSGKPPHYSNFTRAWHRARATVGGDWVPYDLRHLHASLAVARGGQLGSIAERLGHSAETLCRVYLHALPADEGRLNQILEDALACRPAGVVVGRSGSAPH